VNGRIGWTATARTPESLEAARLKARLALFRRSRKNGVNQCLALREEPMDVSTLKRIEADPNYQKLVSERKSFGWTLAIITLVIYYGFLAVVAFAPQVISTKVSGDITIGIIIGVAVILASILLTGIYVLRANSEYDDLTNAIGNALRTGGRK
jgi:uncharacterized membrane protein (DUF485 family)